MREILFRCDDRYCKDWPIYKTNNSRIGRLK